MGTVLVLEGTKTDKMKLFCLALVISGYITVDASTAPPPVVTTGASAAPVTAAPVTAAPTSGSGISLPPIRTTTQDPDVLDCHSCNNAKTLADCTTFDRCDRKTQDCYMDQIITDSAQVVYNAGCRSKDVCQSAASSGNFGFGLGRKRDLTSCSRCCKTENKCNKRLCGIPEGDVLGVPSCYTCDHRSQNAEQNEVRNPEDCVHMSLCSPNEVCVASTTVVGGKPEFFFGCYSKAICKVLMNNTFADLDNCYGKDLTDPNTPDSVKELCGEVETTSPAPGGKRQAGGQVNVCHACCGDTGCNYGDCRVLREQMYAYYKNGLLDFDDLKYKKTP